MALPTAPGFGPLCRFLLGKLTRTSTTCRGTSGSAPPTLLAARGPDAEDGLTDILRRLGNVAAGGGSTGPVRAARTTILVDLPETKTGSQAQGDTLARRPAG